MIYRGPGNTNSVASLTEGSQDKDHDYDDNKLKHG
jgi:hypothetical protein